MRSLPNKFLIKIATVEEYCDISNMTRNQVISKLQTFETSHLKKKKKSIVFQVGMMNSESDANDVDDVGNVLRMFKNPWLC